MAMNNIASDPVAPEFGSAFDGVEFDWSEDGELSLSKTATPEVAPEVTPEVKEAKTEEPPVVKPEVKDPAVVALEDEVSRLTALVDAAQKPAEAPPEAPPAQRTLTDVLAGRDIMDIYSDPAEAEKFEADKFNVQIAPLIDAMRPMMIQWRVTQEVKEMFQTHGKKFEERIPMIKTLSQKRPDLSMQAAYELVKDIPLPATTDAKTGQVEATGGTIPETPPVAVNAVAEAEAIALKAAKLVTEQGVAGTDEKIEQVTTIKQALNKAVEEVLNNG